MLGQFMYKCVIGCLDAMGIEIVSKWRVEIDPRPDTVDGKWKTNDGLDVWRSICKVRM